MAVLDLQTGTRKVLVRGGTHAHYVSSGRGSPTRAEREGGHLVYAAAGTLRAVAFDLPRLETRGTPVPVIPDVVMIDNGGVDAVVAGDGTLAHVSGSGVIGARRTLVWMDRQGRATPIPAPPRPYLYPRLSPEGTRIAVHATDQEFDNWVWDLGRTTLTRVTFDPGIDAYPVWTPDGRRLIFSSERAGTRNLYQGRLFHDSWWLRWPDVRHRARRPAVSDDQRRTGRADVHHNIREHGRRSKLDRRAEAVGPDAVRLVAGFSSRNPMNNMVLSAGQPSMTGDVVRPWFEELKRLVPTK